MAETMIPQCSILLMIPLGLALSASYTDLEHDYG
jgi:hypothetical protein